MAFTSASDILRAAGGKRALNGGQDSTKPRKKQKKERIYEYTALGDIYGGDHNNGRKKLYVWGIFIGHTGWKPTSGTDWYMNLNIRDESCNDMAVRLFFNRESYPTPPDFPEPGSIARIHRVWVDTYNGKIWLIYKQPISALTFYSQKPGDDVKFLWQSSESPTFTSNDEKRLKALRGWAEKQEDTSSQERHYDGNDDYRFRKLKDITECVQCDVLVKILDIRDEEKKQRIMIWDGTGDQEQGGAEISGAIERPSVGRIMPLIAWSGSLHFEDTLIGLWVKIKHLKSRKYYENLELHTVDAEKPVVTIVEESDPQVAKLIEDYNKLNADENKPPAKIPSHAVYTPPASAARVVSTCHQFSHMPFTPISTILKSTKIPNKYHSSGIIKAWHPERIEDFTVINKKDNSRILFFTLFVEEPKSSAVIPLMIHTSKPFFTDVPIVDLEKDQEVLSNLIFKLNKIKNKTLEFCVQVYHVYKHGKPEVKYLIFDTSIN